jgi:hypothetical protein
MGKLVIEGIDYRKLDGIVSNVLWGFERDFRDRNIPEFIEVQGGSGDERDYVVKEIEERTGKIVWGHQEETNEKGVYRIDLINILKYI